LILHLVLLSLLRVVATEQVHQPQELLVVTAVLVAVVAVLAEHLLAVAQLLVQEAHTTEMLVVLMVLMLVLVVALVQRVLQVVLAVMELLYSLRGV
jgi:hypothetical protein